MEEDLLTIEEEKKSFNFRSIFTFKKMLALVFFLLFLNVIYLDMLLLSGTGNKQTIIQRFESITNQVPPSQNKQTQNADVCPQSCISQINQIAASGKTTAISPTQTPIPSNSLAPAVFLQPKEYYVPFGSGSGSSSDWQDVAGLQANVDSASYGTIKSVKFEASLHIPTGNETATVRLYNATDNHPVWNSELSFNGNTASVFLTSSAINLDSGNKVYKVQLKTQLQYTAVLDQSRIHITSN